MKFTDQLSRTVEVRFPPGSIISLVPSQTELLHYLRLEQEVKGITKFCIHPAEWFRSKARIGGTKKLDFDKIRQLQPDLIIGNKEENEESQVRELMKQYPVWMSDIRSLDDALDMIQRVGELTGKKQKAIELKNEIQKKFAAFPAGSAEKRVAYLIWKEPMMAAGEDTFVNDMLRRCGCKNVFAGSKGKSRYPQVTKEELHAARPGLILLSSEPFPFREKHIAEFQDICPHAKILLVDGEMFSWYGSRLLLAADYLDKLRKMVF